MNRKVGKYLSLSLMAVVAVFIVLVSYAVVWSDDDITYQYNFVDFDRHISSLSDVIESQNVHYIYQNGRYFAHVLVQSFCGIWGQPAFALANGMIYILFFLAIFRLCDVKLSDPKAVASIIVLCLLSFQTKMMPSCQIGFVWMFTFTMWLLILFMKPGIKPGVWVSVLCGIAAIIIGNGQEALNTGVSAALSVYWIKNRKRMTLLQYCLMIGFWIGTLSNCLSPGILTRYYWSAGVSPMEYATSVLRFLRDARGIWFLLIVVLYHRFHHKRSWKDIYHRSPFFWNTLIALICLNIAIHFESNRSAFGIELMCIIIGIRELSDKSMSRIWLSLCTLLLMTEYYFQIDGLIKRRNFHQEIVRQYSQSKDGKVYLDNELYVPLASRKNFSGPFFHYGLYTYECVYFTLAKDLSKKYPGKPQVRILPTYLKGKEHVDLGNQLMPYSKGIWVAIQSKSNPAEFVVDRWLPIFPTLIEIESVTIDMTDPKAILEEGDNWRARYISESDYKILAQNLTDTIRLIPPK